MPMTRWRAMRKRCSTSSASSVVDVVGYSMGSYTTSRLALRDERPRRLVLGGAGVYTFRRNPEVAERFAQALEIDDPTTVDDPAGRAWREYADATGVDRIAIACFFRTPRRATDDELASLGSRTLILTGDADEVAGSPTEIAAAIPGARYVSVPARTTRTTIGRSTIRTSRRSSSRFSALRELEAPEEDIARRFGVAAVEDDTAAGRRERSRVAAESLDAKAGTRGRGVPRSSPSRCSRAWRPSPPRAAGRARRSPARPASRATRRRVCRSGAKLTDTSEPPPRASTSRTRWRTCQSEYARKRKPSPETCFVAAGPPDLPHPPRARRRQAQ